MNDARMHTATADRIHTQGLTESQVAASRAEHGTNDLPAGAHQGFLRKLLESFSDPIIRILLVALGVNLLLCFRDGGLFETVGIGAAVFIATFVSALSEYGSQVAFEKLRQESAGQQCRVRRQGRIGQLPVGELVVGDIVLLEAGEKIGADGIVILGELSVDQAALNGESREAVKKPHGAGESSPTEPGTPNRLFRGSVITSGAGEMLVTAVGKHTLYGSLAAELGEKGEASPLRRRLAQLAGLISRIGYTAATAVMAADLSRELLTMTHFTVQNVLAALLHALMLGLTVVVVAVPEGLPMMITLVLSRNMMTMTKNGVMVRKLVGIETAGSMDLLFTDKTGTLTRGEMAVIGTLDATGKLRRRHQSLPAWERELLLLSVTANSGSRIGMRGTKQIPTGGNATDRALLAYLLPIKQPPDPQFLWQVPFDSGRKYAAAAVKASGRTLTLIKGAPERILPKCGCCYGADGSRRPFSPRERADLEAAMGDLGSRAYRLVCLAVSEEGTSEEKVKNGAFGTLTFLSLAALRDEVRREARGAVRSLQDAGISVVMVTGDGKNTACAVAEECGILPPYHRDGGTVSGGELDAMSDGQLTEKLPQLRVIYRALPTHKSRLVRIGKACGRVVGMTGDGVNDAPALKRADIGFAMGGGVDVAKEAGDIVILDNNIASIARAVLYGRTVFKSIRKFIVFQLTVNLCAVGVSLICPFLGIETPITVMQMLWINLIMDTLGALAFAAEPPLVRYMKEKPVKRQEPVMNREMAWQIAVTGSYTVLLGLGFLKLPFLAAPIRQHPEDLYRLTAFFALFVFCGLWGSFNARTERRFLGAELGRNPSFILIMLAVGLVQIAMIYHGGPLFRTVGLTWPELRYVLLLSMTVIPVDLIRKQVLSVIRRRKKRK